MPVVAAIRFERQARTDRRRRPCRVDGSKVEIGPSAHGGAASRRMRLKGGGDIVYVLAERDAHGQAGVAVQGGMIGAAAPHRRIDPVEVEAAAGQVRS